MDGAGGVLVGLGWDVFFVFSGLINKGKGDGVVILHCVFCFFHGVTGCRFTGLHMVQGAVQMDYIHDFHNYIHLYSVDSKS